MLAISVFSNVVFSGSFLILMSLTSPVLSSVAGLLVLHCSLILTRYTNRRQAHNLPGCNNRLVHIRHTHKHCGAIRWNVNYCGVRTPELVHMEGNE